MLIKTIFILADDVHFFKHFLLKNMNGLFDLETLKNTYSSLLEFLCSSKEILMISNNVSNIWKSTDQKFLKLMGSFFIKKSDLVKALIPSSKLYSEIISFCEETNDKELLKWVKSFNNLFLSSVSKSLKKNKVPHASDFDEMMQKLSLFFNNFYDLKTKNETLERTIEELQNELKLSQEKNALLTSSLETLADEECENFRKRLRSGIYSFNVDQSAII